jgi:hypothetical protein
MKQQKISLSVVALALILVLSACSKEQQALNKLEGKWKYTKITVLGFAIDLAQLGYTDASIEFVKCDSKQTQLCTGVINLNGTPGAFTYDMAADGKSVKVIETGGAISTYKITKLTKSDFVYTAPGLDTIINGSPVKLEAEFTCVR